VITNILAVIAGYAMLVYSPWYLLPLAWIFTGTALTGFFVIAHDGGHRSFSNRPGLMILSVIFSSYRLSIPSTVGVSSMIAIMLKLTW